MPCCTNIARLPASACACQHDALALGTLLNCFQNHQARSNILLNILFITGCLQPYSMLLVPSSLLQVGQTGRPTTMVYGCIEWSAFGRISYIRSVRQSMAFSFSAFLQMVTMAKIMAARGEDFQPGFLADQLLTVLGQPVCNTLSYKPR